MENNSTKPFCDATIPSDWEVKLLANIFKLTSGKTKPRILTDNQTDENVYPVYGGNGIMGYSSEYNCDGEKIIIGRVGEYCGTTRFINELCWVTDNALLTKEFLTAIDIKFLSYKLQQEDISKFRSKGGQPLVSQTPIYIHRIVLPKSLPEQRAIASLLSTWDKAISKTQALITQKELRKKWLMQNLLTGRKRVKGFGGEWKEYSIDQLFERTFRYIKWDEKESYELVSIRRRFGGIFFRGNQTGEEISVKKLKSIHSDDFLISKRQVSHGAWAVVAKDFHGAKVSDEYDCLKILKPQKLDSGFWSWFCQQSIMIHFAYLDSIGVHIEKLIFHYSLFKKRKVTIPNSTEEQTAIATILQTADKEIQLLKAKLDKLKEQKKGLMQVLLTGKKRLNLNFQNERMNRIVKEPNSVNPENSVNSDSDK